MVKDKNSAYPIICDLKEMAEKAKIRSSRKLPDIRYLRFINSQNYTLI